MLYNWWVDYLTAFADLLAIPKRSRTYLRENNVYYLDLIYKAA